MGRRRSLKVCVPEVIIFFPSPPSTVLHSFVETSRGLRAQIGSLLQELAPLKARLALKAKTKKLSMTNGSISTSITSQGRLLLSFSPHGKGFHAMDRSERRGHAKQGQEGCKQRGCKRRALQIVGTHSHVCTPVQTLHEIEQRRRAGSRSAHFCYCVLENITLLGRLCTRSNIQQEQHGGSSAKQNSGLATTVQAAPRST